MVNETRKKIKKINPDNENDDDFFWEMHLKQPTQQCVPYSMCCVWVLL